MTKQQKVTEAFKLAVDMRKQAGKLVTLMKGIFGRQEIETYYADWTLENIDHVLSELAYGPTRPSIDPKTLKRVRSLQPRT